MDESWMNAFRAREWIEWRSCVDAREGGKRYDSVGFRRDVDNIDAFRDALFASCVARLEGIWKAALSKFL